MEKQQEMEILLNSLHTKREREELDEYERGVFETLQWILDGAIKPEIE